jgi:hypothetical protein
VCKTTTKFSPLDRIFLGCFGQGCVHVEVTLSSVSGFSMVLR